MAALDTSPIEKLVARESTGALGYNPFEQPGLPRAKTYYSSIESQNNHVFAAKINQLIDKVNEKDKRIEELETRIRALERKTPVLARSVSRGRRNAANARQRSTSAMRASKVAERSSKSAARTSKNAVTKVQEVRNDTEIERLEWEEDLIRKLEELGFIREP
jgi:hypothetical protein